MRTGLSLTEASSAFSASTALRVRHASVSTQAIQPARHPSPAQVLGPGPAPVSSASGGGVARGEGRVGLRVRGAAGGEQAGALSQAPCEAARGAHLLPQAWPPFISIPSCQHRAWRAGPSPPLPCGPRLCPWPLSDPRPTEQAFAGSPAAVTLKRSLSLVSSTGNAGPSHSHRKGPSLLALPRPHSWDPLGI